MNLKYSLRAFFAYEQITGDSYTPSTLNNTILFYCFRITSGIGYDKNFDEFVDECDENPKMFSDFLEWLSKEAEKRAIYNKEDKAKKK